MAAVQAAFDAAVARVQDKSASPLTLSSAEKLQFYALYKLATQGPAPPQPRHCGWNIIEQQTENAKHAAWKALGGMSKADAMRTYAGLVAAYGARGR